MAVLVSSYLITGGTGSMGQALTYALLEDPKVERIAVYSRDEWKQSEMQNAFPDERLRFFLGDVRDRDRLRRAMQGVSRVIHCAALKQVPACEYNPIEAVKTNVDGTANVIDAALDAQVGRVLMLSSDKACDPVNLYGATKLVAEKLMVDANVYSRAGTPRFACTRYGNVLWSRGSVLERWDAELRDGEPLSLTDLRMTRFVLTVGQAAHFILDCLERMNGGEVFVPRLPACDLATMAQALIVSREHLASGVFGAERGARPGEKTHEMLISEHEAHRAVPSLEAGYAILPTWENADYSHMPGSHVRVYTSDQAPRLTVEEFRELAGL